MRFDYLFFFVLSLTVCVEGLKQFIPHLIRSNRKNLVRDSTHQLEQFTCTQREQKTCIKGSFYDEEDGSVPRLHPDVGSYISWVVDDHGGIFNAEIVQSKEGWNLATTDSEIIPKDTTLVRIPKKLCIFSDPSLMTETQLLDSTKQLMQSLHPSHWRARLAIALLSERVKPQSFFHPYLRNLPFEFWGMPVFFSSTEFKLVQDVILMQRTRERCRFLKEFTDDVLMPLQRAAKFTSSNGNGGIDMERDPFSGNLADINAFGWGFACASSRALRYINSAESSEVSIPSRVIIPGIDLVKHSFQPNCRVVDTGTAYELVTDRDIHPASSSGENGKNYGDELSIDYGPMSNEELLADFGFTVDRNPHDRLRFSVDALTLNTARAIMGQSRFSQEALVKTTALESDASTNQFKPGFYSPAAFIPTMDSMKMPTDSSSSSGGNGNDNDNGRRNAMASSDSTAFTLSPPMGRAVDVYHSQWLHSWQLLWVECLSLPPTVPAAATALLTATRALSTAAQALTPSIPSAEFVCTAPKICSSASSKASTGTPTDAVIEKPGMKYPIDPKLLALLRVLYTPDEEHLEAHGYDPFLLQQAGALVTVRTEAHVVRTVIGLLALLLRSLNTTLNKDIQLLKYGIDECSSRSSSSSSSSSSDMFGTKSSDSKSMSLDDTQAIAEDVRRILRGILNINEGPDSSSGSTTAAIQTSNSGSSTNSATNAATNDEDPNVGDNSSTATTSIAASVEDLIRRDLFAAEGGGGGIAAANGGRSTSENGNSDGRTHNEDINSADVSSSSSDETSVDSVMADLIAHEAKSEGSQSDLSNTLTPTRDSDTSSTSQQQQQEQQLFYTCDEGLPISLDEIGQSLPINVRESYRYRIRRKQMIIDLIQELAAQYELLRVAALSESARTSTTHTTTTTTTKHYTHE
mmetsp:Transcript_526/g.720  ORF Transcript_526/g.720 Transcript_526/m.720 type:complete len:918 (+) Transcript_526:20-2773(+)